jgi:hypothetical protein
VWIGSAGQGLTTDDGGEKVKCLGGASGSGEKRLTSYFSVGGCKMISG